MSGGCQPPCQPTTTELISQWSCISLSPPLPSFRAYPHFHNQHLRSTSLTFSISTPPPTVTVPIRPPSPSSQTALDCPLGRRVIGRPRPVWGRLAGLAQPQCRAGRPKEVVCPASFFFAACLRGGGVVEGAGFVHSTWAARLGWVSVLMLGSCVSAPSSSRLLMHHPRGGWCVWLGGAAGQSTSSWAGNCPRLAWCLGAGGSTVLVSGGHVFVMPAHRGSRL